MHIVVSLFVFIIHTDWLASCDTINIPLKQWNDRKYNEFGPTCFILSGINCWLKKEKAHAQIFLTDGLLWFFWFIYFFSSSCSAIVFVHGLFLPLFKCKCLEGEFCLKVIPRDQVSCEKAFNTVTFNTYVNMMHQIGTIMFTITFCVYLLCFLSFNTFYMNE